MKNKIIKLTENQIKKILNEDYPFSYMGTESTDINHGDEINAEGPYIDSSGIEPEPVTGDKISHMLTNDKLWRNYGGYNSYCK